METIKVSTGSRPEFIDITLQVEALVKKSKIKQGLAIIFCPHTTAALTINENADYSVKQDILGHLQKLVPKDKAYLHSEGNSDAHIKSSMLGSSLNVIISNSSLALGTWQGIYFCEFDGPRERQVFVKLISD